MFSSYKVLNLNEFDTLMTTKIKSFNYLLQFKNIFIHKFVLSGKVPNPNKLDTWMATKIKSFNYTL